MMRFISRKIHKASDLTSIIHVGNFSPIASEAAQVQHSTILPKKSMHGGKAGGFSGSRIDVRKSGYLAALVDVLGECVRATQGAKVAHHTVLPEKCARLRSEAHQRRFIRDRVLGEANDLPAIIQGVRLTEGPSEGAEINYLAVMPEDSDLLRNAR